jgi:hypothetical protein
MFVKIKGFFERYFILPLFNVLRGHVRVVRGDLFGTRGTTVVIECPGCGVLSTHCNELILLSGELACAVWAREYECPCCGVRFNVIFKIKADVFIPKPTKIGIIV